MKTRKYIISLVISGFFGIAGIAQNPSSLYFMETIPQLTRINPAMQPRANGFFALPSVSLNIHSDLACKDFIQKSGNQWHLPYEAEYSYKDLYKRIGNSYDLMFNSEIALFGFGFRMGKGYLSFTVSEKVETQFGLAKDLFKITEEGLPDGSKHDFSKFYAKALAYSQLSIGYSHKITDELTVGVNIRPLLGTAAAV
jgi:hypothetical protein